MTTAADTITSLIDKLVEEKTFSVEGVKGIEQLRQLAETQAEELKRLSTSRQEIGENLHTAQRSLEAKNAEVLAWQKREEEIKQREAAVHLARIEQAADKAKATTAMECFGLVFRNTTVRETVLGNTPIPNNTPGGYPVMMANSSTTDRTPQ